jgi:hypothetical protein
MANRKPAPLEEAKHFFALTVDKSESSFLLQPHDIVVTCAKYLPFILNAILTKQTTNARTKVRGVGLEPTKAFARGS